MIPFRRRVELVVFVWVVLALCLLGVGIGAGWAVGGSAALVGACFLVAELTP